jgi:RNA polymerase sigma factor (sigma-70 family)
MGEEEQLGSLLPVAYYLAHFYEHLWGQPDGEFETAALIGAWDAVKRYSPERGASLATYARFRIRGEIVDWHRTEQQQKGGSRRKHMRKYTYCVDFNDLEIEDGLLSEGAWIEKMYGRKYEKGFSEIEDHDVLKHLKTRMDEKEWDIMVRCICNEECMKDVGKIYGVSESRICQILPIALKHARKIIEEMEQCPEVLTHDQISKDKDAYRESVWLRLLSASNFEVG